MPKRVIDFDAMWGSDKLAACAEWAQAEYAWFYGLADASGGFELTNLRGIWDGLPRYVATSRSSGLNKCSANFTTRDCCLCGSTKENVTRIGLAATFPAD